jgi:hypothetical protein
MKSKVTLALVCEKKYYLSRFGGSGISMNSHCPALPRPLWPYRGAAITHHGPDVGAEHKVRTADGNVRIKYDAQRGDSWRMSESPQYDRAEPQTVPRFRTEGQPFPGGESQRQSPLAFGRGKRYYLTCKFSRFWVQRQNTGEFRICQFR